ncbi:MAG: WecB/TagA/CpsF family glycosyltransferase [Candidatus Omnitrophica bacterium]|nr:WecB/TagA/CpsF family glycosyltransferase [Candidatus Omnitrophota bacterium]
MTMRSVELFGMPFENVTMPQALERIDGLVRQPGRRYVMTPNIDAVVRWPKDPEFRDAYQRAALIFADGMPIVLASRLLGSPLKERIAGSDLFPRLCRQAAERGHSVFFLGGQDGVAEQAARNLRGRFPSLRVVGCYAPPIGFQFDAAEHERMVQRVNSARPDLLFLALGCPKQEKWIAKHIHELEVKVAVCVGAAIDFEAGTVRRAPRWMQRSGLEWLWRLVREPRRLWRRYLIEDTAFVGLFLSEWWRVCVRRAEAGGPVASSGPLRSGESS